MKMSEDQLEQRRAWLRSLTQKDRDFIARHGQDMWQKMKDQQAQAKQPQETEESQSLEKWSTETSKRLKKVVQREWHLNEVISEKILRQKEAELERKNDLLKEEIQESYSGFKAQLSSEVDQAIKAEIMKLNGQKAKLNLQFNEQIQENLTKFLKPIQDACMALSTRQAKIVTLTFMVVKGNKIKMLVHYD